MSSAAQFGFILENIGGGELVVIAFLALVVLGPERIPEMARGAGKMLHNLKKLTTDLSGDMQDVMNDPAMQPIRELGEFATRPRQKLAEYALEAEAEERVRQAQETTPPDDPGDSGEPGEFDGPGEFAGPGDPEDPEGADTVVAPTLPDGSTPPQGPSDIHPVPDDDPGPTGSP